MDLVCGCGVGGVWVGCGWGVGGVWVMCCVHDVVYVRGWGVCGGVVDVYAVAAIIQ